MIQPFRTALLTTMIWILAGCAPEVPVNRAEPGPIPFQPQRQGDPELGYEILVNRGYVTCGIPLEAFRDRAEGAEYEQRVMGRLGRNAELPYRFNATFNEEGVELVVSNCLTCHAGEIEGELVVGLGDAFLDFSEDPMPAVEGFGLYVEDGAPAAAWRRWADRMGAIAPYMITDTFGVNPAPTLTLALMAHRDPRTLRWHEAPRMEPPPARPLPTKVPPWWRMAKKHAMFHHGAGRGDQVGYMMLKSLVCTDDLDEAGRIDEWFTHVRAYIASLGPPEFPYPVDPDLAAQGLAVFERNCARCHGSYGENSSYPNLVVGLDEIGTDPLYARDALAADRFIRWFNASYYGRNAEARPAAGYVAPPLDGVWATAPFLHNGSVPSIEALLDTGKRPRYWRLAVDPREYDPATLGWRFEELDHGKEGAADRASARMIYDTTRPGYGNQGHAFGDSLTAAERRAVIEYLKTL